MEIAIGPGKKNQKIINVGPGKNPKLINVGPTFIPESRVSSKVP